jgi:hypothetical protein
MVSDKVFASPESSDAAYAHKIENVPMFWGPPIQNIVALRWRTLIEIPRYAVDPRHILEIGEIVAVEDGDVESFAQRVDAEAALVGKKHHWMRWWTGRMGRQLLLLLLVLLWW